MGIDQSPPQTQAEIDIFDSNTSQSKTFQTILEELEHCNNLDDIRRICKPRAMRDRGQQIQLSSSAFQQLLVKAQPIEMILEFLEDSQLNIRTSRNLQTLLTHQIQKSSIETREDELLSHWIRTQIMLGLVRLHEIAPLLEMVYRPGNKRTGALSRESLIRNVAEGVQRSTLVSPSDTKEKALNAILICSSYGKSTMVLDSLGWELVMMPLTLQSRVMDKGVSSFISSWVSKQIDLDKSVTAESKGIERFEQILNKIKALPDRLMEACIIQTSKTLVTRIRASTQMSCDDEDEVRPERKMHLEQLSSWWSSLQFSGLLSNLQQRPSWQGVERTLGSHARDVFLTYLRLLDHSSKCFFLIRHSHVPASESKSPLKHGRDLKLRARAEAQFRDLCLEHPERSPFTNLLLTIRLANQPGAWNVQGIFDIIRSIGMSGTTMVLLRGCDIAHVRLDVRVVIKEINNHLQRNEPRTAYCIFQSFAFLPLELVPNLARAMIASPDLCPSTAFFYRGSRQKWLNQGEICQRDPQRRAQLQTQLLNCMAEAYSRSLHAPRAAFHQVYKCYLLLRSSSLPVTATITAALTFAGVVRYINHGAWVSTVRYRLIRSLVQTVEGQEVADRLDHLVYTCRGRLLTQNADRRRREISLGLPRGSLCTKAQHEESRIRYTQQSIPLELVSEPKIRWQRMHWPKNAGFRPDGG